uniref:Uncharacterized protein n=1 Tax=Arundo donax TaxID=35708 RepID=A0A0A9GUK2_ARUDO
MRYIACSPYNTCLVKMGLQSRGHL